MGCYDNQEIADAIGFARPAVSEFVNFIPIVTNGTGAISDVSSENPELTSEPEREFDEEKEEDSGRRSIRWRPMGLSRMPCKR